MNDPKKIYVLDLIPFHGGSKNATLELLKQFDSSVEVQVYSLVPEYWDKDFLATQLMLPEVLAESKSGVLFYLKQFFVLLQLLLYILLNGRPQAMLGASGPGVDLSMYFLAKLIPMHTIQTIHGNVGTSRSITYALNSASIVSYLHSSKDSIENNFLKFYNQADAKAFFEKPTNMPFVNGLSEANWPSACTDDFKEPKVFWAASLLKWKGLDVLINALDYLGEYSNVSTKICYIQPKNSYMPSSKEPVVLRNREVFKEPENLDSIRSSSNIFVSTSEKEPFGLSILEALASGLCVLIPRDGAYWDMVLTSGKDCYKYDPNNSEELAELISRLSEDMANVKNVGEAGKRIASSYQARLTYLPIVRKIEGLLANVQGQSSYI